MLSHKQRKNSGSLGGLLLASVILIAFGLGSFAVDLAHIAAVRSELQNATDAAALAGAQDLQNDPAMADVDAIQVASENNADGHAVSPLVPNTTVNPTVTPVSNSGPGSVEVDATTRIKNMAAPIYGRHFDWLGTTSIADFWAVVNGIAPGQVFPIAPSLDDTSQGPALNTKQIGDALTLVISSSGGNAAWTSGGPSLPNPSTPVIEAAVDGALGINPPNANTNPGITADGSNQIALTQGMHNGIDLSSPPYPALMEAKPFLVLPIIAGSTPYTQERTVLGFILLKVESVTGKGDKLTIQGKLVSGLVQGTGGSLPAGGNSISQLSPGTVKLVR